MCLLNVKDVLCEVSISPTHFLVQTVRIEQSKFNVYILKTVMISLLYTLFHPQFS